MNLSSALIILLSVLITLCNSQSYSRYSNPAQRRAGYTYTQPYYNQPKTYYPLSSNRNTVQSSAYNRLSNPSTSNSYYQQTPQRNYKQQTSSSSYPATSPRGSYNPYNHQSSLSSSSSSNPRRYGPSNSINHNAVSSSTSTGSRGSYNNQQSSSSIYRNTGQTSPSTGSRGSYNSASDPISNKQYLTNSYSNDKNNNKDTTSSSISSYSDKLLQNVSNGKYRVSKADTENAKFAGADNQEDEEDGRTLHLKRKKLRRRLGALSSPCFPYGRDAGSGGTSPPKEQGRFLWDVKVTNVYPQTNSFGGCGGGLGGGGLGGLGGGGLLSDPIDQPYYPPGAGLANFLGLFAPGVLQNSLAATARPPLYADSFRPQNNYNDNLQNDDLQSDPEVDPNYRPQQPVRRPNRIYYDSAGAPPVTPGQLLGGVATTVNGIIQQLTGNVQPVYG